MKAIIVSNKDFEDEFEKCLDKLSIKRFQESHFNSELQIKIEDIHRAFVYEIHNLKQRLIEN